LQEKQQNPNNMNEQWYSSHFFSVQHCSTGFPWRRQPTLKCKYSQQRAKAK
jgi:hypothetical protein